MKFKYSKQIISWSLVLIWVIIIYYFSSKNADASNELSQGTLAIIIDLFHIKEFPILHYLIRKLAHMIEYAILFTLVFNASYYTFPSIYMPSFSITLGFACLDEFHQLFVPGRSGQLFDVGIDMIGACIACLIIYIVRYKLVKKGKIFK